MFPRMQATSPHLRYITRKDVVPRPLSKFRHLRTTVLMRKIPETREGQVKESAVPPLPLNSEQRSEIAFGAYVKQVSSVVMAKTIIQGVG